MPSTLYLVTLGLAASAAAQITKNLPVCAQGCLGTSIQDSGCQGFDYNCICGDTALISQLSCCIFKSCDPADQGGALAFGNGICQGATPPVELPQSASCPADAASTTPTADGGSFYAQTTMPPTSTPNFLLPPITESVYSSDYLASLYSRVSVHASSRVRPFPIASSVSPDSCDDCCQSLFLSSPEHVQLICNCRSAAASSASSASVTAVATSPAESVASSAAPTAAASSGASSVITSKPASSAPAPTGASQAASSVSTGAAPAFGHRGELTGIVGGLVGAAAFFL